MGTLSSKGNINPQAWVVVIWGTLTGAAAAILLLAGGLDGLQTAAILSAAPFVLVMIGLCWSLFKALRTEQVPGVVPGTEAPEPGRAMSRPWGVSAPQQMAREEGPE
jgi:choline-glycine betaine transporter